MQSTRPELRDGRLKEVREKNKPFLDRNRERAARLVAEGKMTYTAIAKDCEKSLEWLMKLKRTPEFVERVIELQDIYSRRMINYGIANKSYRVKVLNEIHDGLTQVRRNREEQYKDEIPGGNPEGLLVVRKKSIGGGDSAEIIEEAVLDTGLIAETRNVHEQVAKELGQISTKHEFAVDDPLEQLLGEFRKENAKVEDGSDPLAENKGENQ